MTTDLISNMLSSLQNAISLKHSTAKFMYNDQCLGITKVLYNYGFLKSYSIYLNKLNNQRFIKIKLRYIGYWFLRPSFSKIIRISKPGKRIYVKKIKLEKVKNSIGFFIVSSSSGLMTHIEAYKLKKGGEIICYVR